MLMRHVHPTLQFTHILPYGAILHENGVYYLYATSSREGLLVWTSRDLVNWQVRGFAYKRSGQTWANHDFWAPELFTPSKSLAIPPPSPLTPLPMPVLPVIAAKIPKPVADCVSGGISRVTAW